MRILLKRLNIEVQAEKPYEMLHARCSDWGAVQQDVLKKQSRRLQSGLTCVFGDSAERLPSDARQWVDETAPGKDNDRLDSQALKANQTITAFYDDNKDWLFDKNRMCYCHVHRRGCPAYPGQGFFTPDVFGAPMEIPSDQPSVKKRKLIRRESATTSQLTPWYKHITVESTDKPRPLIFNVSGLVCKDYSQLGKQKGVAGRGESQRHHDWYCVEREMLAKAGLEDFFLTECAERYPAESLQKDFLSKTHDVHVVRASPVEMGFPIRRRRTFTIGINRETMIWTGPTDPAKVQHDFEALFTRTVEMSGDCFFCAKGQDIETFLCERVALRKTILPSNYKTENMGEFLHVLLARSAMERKAIYDSKQFEKGGIWGAFLIDVEQICQLGCQPGPVCPPLNTHSEIYSYELSRAWPSTRSTTTCRAWTWTTAWLASVAEAPS